VQISRALLERVVAHAQRDEPHECCGLVATRDGRATAVYETENLAASPLRFEMGPELARLAFSIEDDGDELGAIYHSHTRSAPEPSQTDINFAALWPGVAWLIVGLDAGAVDVRCWRIDDGVVSELELVVA
jgi:proteasome lid subunit RPN8/RPN11